MTDAAALSLGAVRKLYSGVPVLDDVDLDLHYGKCVALLGQNGAGKSTLLRIIAGATQPSSGEVRLNGRVVALRSPADARNGGIVLIPQELADLPDMTVAENIALYSWPRGRVWLERRLLVRQASATLNRLGINIEPGAVVRDLGVGERQLVEIAKVLAARANVVLLDEPTAALDGPEIARLLATVRRMKRDGQAILYVSHRIEECLQVADEIVVLRDGRVVGRLDPVETTKRRVIELMIGHELQEIEPRSEKVGSGGAPALEVRDLMRSGVPFLRDVNFALHPGEIVTLFGTLGSGIEAVARGLGGGDQLVSGEISVPGRTARLPITPTRARSLGIAYVPADRKREGIAMSRAVREHLTLMIASRTSRAGVISRRSERHHSRLLIRNFGIHCRDEEQPVGELSGGNQQKVLLASRLAHGPSVLVLHEPTRGVDVGAREQIYSVLSLAAERGAAVLLVTPDVDEARRLAHRILVFHNGTITAEYSGTQPARDLVGAAVGAHVGGG